MRAIHLRLWYMCVYISIASYFYESAMGIDSLQFTSDHDYAQAYHRKHSCELKLLQALDPNNLCMVDRLNI